jgi:predicted enzyme related to lactoylglutathione lyase
MPIKWLTAFLDFPPGTFGPASAYWQAVTGYQLSAPRGPAAEFATLLPGQGSAFLRVQRTGGGSPGCHLDVHTAEVRALTDRALRLGARPTDQDPVPGLAVLRSPGGIPFCLTSEGDFAERPRPRLWPAGQRSLLDQVCIDIPGSAMASETAFWAGLTGWPLRDNPESEFASLARPEGMPLRLLLQRLGEPTGPCRAHPDLACDDVPAEVRRHQALGGTVLRVTGAFTTLLDPAGLPYCVTTRNPGTGLRPG